MSRLSAEASGRDSAFALTVTAFSAEWMSGEVSSPDASKIFLRSLESSSEGREGPAHRLRMVLPRHECNWGCHLPDRAFDSERLNVSCDFDLLMVDLAAGSRDAES